VQVVAITPRSIAEAQMSDGEVGEPGGGWVASGRTLDSGIVGSNMSNEDKARSEAR
jgi:hypothetical protein